MPQRNGLVSASVLAMLLVGAFSGAITGLVLANMSMNQVWLAVISALIAVVLALLVGRAILGSSVRLRLWSQVVIWNAIVASLIGGLAGHELTPPRLPIASAGATLGADGGRGFVSTLEPSLCGRAGAGRRAAILGGDFVRLSSHDDLQMAQGGVTPWSGTESAARQAGNGATRSLTPGQEQQVFRWINGRDPRQYGLDFGLWTRSVVADLIERKFNIRLGVTAVGASLAKLGLTPQKPLQRAYQRDPDAIEAWRLQRFPAIARQAKTSGGEVSFLG